MKRIFKFQIAPVDEKFDTRMCSAMMPSGGEIISLGVQRDKIYVWAIVDDEMPHELRKFRIFHTDDVIDVDTSKMKLLGTVQLFNGELVKHVFEWLQ